MVRLGIQDVYVALVVFNVIHSLIIVRRNYLVESPASRAPYVHFQAFISRRLLALA